MKKLALTLFVCGLSTALSFGQNNGQTNPTSTESSEEVLEHRHSLGSSLFMLYNFTEESAEFYLLTYGHQLTRKDRIFTEFCTWIYSEPMGTYGNSDAFYPGFVRTYGIGFGYQRFHWKGLFTTIQGTPFLKQYYDTNDEKTQKGFQLYLQLALGYRIEFFKKRLYVEPAVALKYWPIDTNIPEDFASVEAGTPNTIIEPSLNFGFKF